MKASRRAAAAGSPVGERPARSGGPHLATQGLPGHWQGDIAGQAIILTLQADGNGLLNGQPIRYGAADGMLAIERQGQVTSYAHQLHDGMLLIAGGELPGLLVLHRGVAPEPALPPAPSAPGRSGGHPPDLVGQWCRVSSGNSSAGGWFSQYCITLHADGRYEYFSTSDRSVHTSSIDGRATGETLDAGHWAVSGPVLTAHSQSGRVTALNLRRGRDPRNGEAQLWLDGECFGAMTNAHRW